jgi:hypothetical protein
LDEKILYLGTIYNDEGTRVGDKLGNEAASVAELTKRDAAALGDKFTTKFWVCRETEMPAIKK